MMSSTTFYENQPAIDHPYLAIVSGRGVLHIGIYHYLAFTIAHGILKPSSFSNVTLAVGGTALSLNALCGLDGGARISGTLTT